MLSLIIVLLHSCRKELADELLSVNEELSYMIIGCCKTSAPIYCMLFASGPFRIVYFMQGIDKFILEDAEEAVQDTKKFPRALNVIEGPLMKVC